MAEKIKTDRALTPEEIKLLEVIREVGYGELTISVRNGLPYHVEEIRKSISLK